jgi:hypothetical protein
VPAVSGGHRVLRVICPRKARKTRKAINKSNFCIVKGIQLLAHELEHVISFEYFRAFRAFRGQSLISLSNQYLRLHY